MDTPELYTQIKDRDDLKYGDVIYKEKPAEEKSDQPTIVVGDLHGAVEIIDAVLDLNQRTIFIGDYIDSYDRTVEEQFTTLTKVLDAVKSGKAIALRGNHEMSYLHQEMMCSGHSGKMDALLSSDFDGSTVRKALEELLLPYHFAEGFLISHAGVSQKLLNLNKTTLSQYLKDSLFSDIGWSRGGRSPVGGLYWCDWDCDFKPVPYQPQIVGHSRRPGNVIEIKDNSYCIDVLYHNDPIKTVVEIKDGQLKERKIDTTNYRKR